MSLCTPDKNSRIQIENKCINIVNCQEEIISVSKIWAYFNTNDRKQQISSLLEIWDTARIPAICDWPSDHHSQFILQPELFSHLLKWNSFQHLSPAVFLWRQVGASPYIHRCSNIAWKRSILSMLLLEAWSFNVIGPWSVWVDPQNKIIEWVFKFNQPWKHLRCKVANNSES